MYRVSFTGYRPEKLPFFGEDDPLCAELKAKLRAQIKELIESGADIFNSGMALGVDTWAAEAVLELKKEYPQIALNAFVPCPEQADRWKKADKARYTKILGQCAKVITVEPRYTKCCMTKRNHALVDMCDVLVAVFDGKSGGTKQTVDYAKSKDREIILLSPI